MPEKRLILEYDDFAQRAEAFYARLDESEAAREMFVKDPVGVLNALMPGDAGTRHPASINQSNRVLYALLSNREFMAWVETFQRELIEGVADETDSPQERVQLLVARLDRPRLYEQLVDAALKHIDREILYSIFFHDEEPLNPNALRASDLPAGRWQPVSDEVLVVTKAIVAIIAVVALHIAVTQVDLTPVAPREDISRVDLQRVSSLLADGLQRRADELRAAGQLTSFDSVKRGEQL